MSEILAHGSFHLGGELRKGKWSVVLLSTFLAGEDAGGLGPARLQGLKQALAAHAGQHILVAMHHHPLPMGSTWLDGVALRDAQSFWQIIDTHPEVRAVVCGHVHQASDRTRNRLRFLSTPSTCAQFLPGNEFFALDDRPPACAGSSSTTTAASKPKSAGSRARLVHEFGLMIRRSWLALLAAWLPAALASADPAAWRMTGRNGGEVTLLGSMHVLRPSDYPLPPTVDALIDGADDIVMEIDLDDVDAGQQQLIVQTAMLPQGKVLADVLDADVYRLVAQHMSELGVDVKALEHFEPWFLSITVLDLGMRKLGFQPDRGVEQYVVGSSAH
jgi:hypothetical protein